MSAKIIEVEVEEPVELYLVLKLTRTEARDLYTRMRQTPYPRTPTRVVQDICDAFNDYGFSNEDYIYPEGITHWSYGWKGRGGYEV